MFVVKGCTKLRLAVVPEGPLSFDGSSYLYSEGEGFYIDGLAQHFEEVVVCAYAFHIGDPGFHSACHYRFRSPNIRFIELPLKRKPRASIFSKLLQMLSVAGLIASQMRTWDMIYLFIPSYPSAVAFILNKYFQKPYFVYAASDWGEEESALIYRWDGWSRRILLPLCTRFSLWVERQMVRGALFVLTAGVEALQRYHPWNERVFETIPRMNWPELRICQREDTCGALPIRLLFVGYLYERKGVRYLLEALPVLQKNGLTEVTLSIVGTGEQRKDLEGLTKRLGIEDRVTFHGHVQNGPSLYEIFRRSDIFVIPSLGEGFPRVLYEAMANGLPIVTTNVSGIPHKMRHQETALLVPPRDLKALAGAIERLVRDHSLRRKLISNGRAFMENLVKHNDGAGQVSALLTEASLAYRSCRGSRLS